MVFMHIDRRSALTVTLHLQSARLEALETFRTGAATLLLATDVAARGLDILGVDAVVNFDCPRSVETYLHRVGRTARAGRGGLAITIAEDGDRGLLKAVVKQVGVQLARREVPPAVIDSWRRRTEALTATIHEVLQVRSRLHSLCDPAMPLPFWPALEAPALGMHLHRRVHDSTTAASHCHPYSVATA